MLKILIVDDEPDICELIHKLIDWEDLGLVSLGSSQNGVDAMEIILRQKPDIVTAATGNLTTPGRPSASAWRTTCSSPSARRT